MTKSKVAVLRTNPGKVLDDYVRLFEMADGPKHLNPGLTTIIKDNISWHLPFPSANTTPWQLEGAILALKKHKFDKITCVQNKTEVTNAYKGERLNLYVPLFQNYKLEVLYNFLKSDMKWIVYKPKAKMLILNKIYKNTIRIPDYFIGKNMLHLPTVKCHIYTTTTGALKNAFGGLLNHKRHQTHTYIHETLVDLLAIQKEIHPGLFCIMDGTTAGNGGGPRIMTPVKKDVILASADQVAIDAVAAKLMGFDPMSIKYINLAHEAGLGVGKPEEIEIVGDADLLKENWGFQVKEIFHKKVANLTWFGPTRVIFQGLFTHYPILFFGNFYSFLYHDLLHWPLKEKHIYEKWLKESEWGEMFRQYQEKGHLA